ncbi:MAG: 1-phosphofructokinase, partial [Eubacterium sp.]|nr:1-phosphofructokinase [Eubacterium sp.]
MIYTLTLNPALDYVIKSDTLSAEKINKCYENEIYYGGKGINVSCVLKELGLPNKALGFISGFTGNELE